MIESGNPKLLALIRQSLADIVPDDWYSVDDWCRKFKKSRPQTQRYLSIGVNIGLVERRVFKIVVGEKICHVAHYRECQKKKQKK